MVKVKFFGYNNDVMVMPCPCCQTPIRFYKDFPKFKLNDGRKKLLCIPGMYLPYRPCINLLCKWSDATDD